MGRETIEIGKMYRERRAGKGGQGTLTNSAVEETLANQAPLTASDREPGLGKVGREKWARKQSK